ncbi:TIGR04053 family radical SAM/SPASM domain-containing protein [Streptomyces sp. NRRL F-2747]|uniref:TIGR04053 family radical SAM/SPASM domain-containing protein n=1 Tax=Streptomyces sp. NRRL F-2747 TaxID=1463843 RepID=UPI00099BE826|nr:TIGR04053 family radical SAM/SPASM domain-containing protein [Streptomyces sp. NRRL F-2747]
MTAEGAGRTVVRRPRQAIAERPFIVIWEATRACPLACLHCRAEAQTARHPEELDGAGARRVMDQVAAFGRPAPLFVITGGDPFQRPDLTGLVAYGTSLGLRVAVSPSGTPTLTRERLAAVRDAGAVAVSLSLDGSTARRHDAFRGVPGVYGQTLEGWRAARELGLKVQINTTVSRHSLADIADIAALVGREGAMLWSGFVLVPAGRGGRLDCLDPGEVEDVLHFLYDCGAVLATKTTEGHHFRRVALQRAVLEARGERPVLGALHGRLSARAAELGLFDGARRTARRPPMDVSSGRGFVFVSHTGEVHPSGFLPVSAGNVKNRPLTGIYRDSALFTTLRDPSLLGGKCGRCEFKEVCGGSRSRAYGFTGDVLAADPYCAYEPGSFPYPEELGALTAPAAPAAPTAQTALAESTKRRRHPSSYARRGKTGARGRNECAR